MHIRTKKLIKNTSIFAISNIVSKIISFLFIPLYTYVLTTIEYGTYDLVITSVSILLPIFSLNIESSIIIFCLENKYIKSSIISIGIKYILISNVIFFLSLSLITIFNLMPSFNNLFFYIILYFLFYSFNTLFAQVAKGLEKINVICIESILSTVLSIFFNITFLVVFKFGIKGMFYALILNQFIIFLYYFISIDFIKYLKEFNIDKVLEKNMVIFSIPLIFSAIGWWANNAADKYVVTLFCGVAANGILAISYKIPNIINIMQNVFMQAWQITAMQEYYKDDNKLYFGAMFNKVNTLMCLTASLLMFLSKYIARLIFSRDFYVAWKYVPFLLIASVINTASGFLGPILSAKKDSKVLANAAIVGLISNIILNFILIYFLGIQGGCIATAISSYCIYFVRKKSISDDIIIYNYYKTYLCWVLLSIEAICIAYLNINLIPIIFVFIIFFINKQDIFDIFSFIFNNCLNKLNIKHK